MIDYTLSVAALRLAVAELKDTDRVTVNTVGNLLVLRNDEKIGYIQIRAHAEDAPLELYQLQE